jgi:hypothetical protein
MNRNYDGCTDEYSLSQNMLMDYGEVNVGRVKILDKFDTGK